MGRARGLGGLMPFGPSRPICCEKIQPRSFRKPRYRQIPAPGHPSHLHRGRGSGAACCSTSSRTSGRPATRRIRCFLWFDRRNRLAHFRGDQVALRRRRPWKSMFDSSDDEVQQVEACAVPLNHRQCSCRLSGRAGPIPAAPAFAVFNLIKPITAAVSAPLTPPDAKPPTIAPLTA